MDEEAVSLTIKEKLEIINGKLDEFEGKAGLVKLKELGECEVIETPIDEIRFWTSEMLSDAAMELSQYSLRLTRIINKKKADKIILEGELKYYLGDKIPSGYGYFEEKKYRVIAQDEYAYAVDRLINRTSAAIARLEDLPAKILQMQKAIEGMRYAKKDERH